MDPSPITRHPIWGLELDNSTVATPGGLRFRACCLRACGGSRMAAASLLELGLGEIGAVHLNAMRHLRSTGQQHGRDVRSHGP
jgi:hypothetical protein